MNGGPLNRRGLTIKQALFVKSYVQTGGNGVLAAQKAGYNSSYYVLASIASENLNKPKVQRELQRTMSKILNAEEVLSELTEISRSSPEIKGSDKLKALELIGKNLKLWTDKVETSAPQEELKAKILAEVVRECGIAPDRAALIVDAVYNGMAHPAEPEMVSEASQ